MAVTNTWTIGQLEYNNDSDNGVVIAHWRCIGTETIGEGDDAITYSASSYSTQSFTPDASAEGYVAYADLTESIVVGWVQEAVGQDTVEAGVATQIEGQKNPTMLAGVPW